MFTMVIILQKGTVGLEIMMKRSTPEITFLFLRL